MTPPKPTLDDLRIARSSNPEAPKRILPAALAVGALAVVALITWWSLRPGPIAVKAVMTREATRAGGERTVLNASGYVTARRAATVSSKVTGKVVEVLIEEGMRVKEGQVLARLDDTNVRASLVLAQAQLASAKAALEETRVRLKEAEQELRAPDRTHEGTGGHQGGLRSRRGRGAGLQGEAGAAAGGSRTWPRAPSRSGSSSWTTP